MRGQAWGGILLALLLVPTAWAEPAEGSLFVEGPLLLDAAGALDFTPLAIYTNRSADLEGFVLETPRLTVYRYNWSFAETDLVATRLATRTGGVEAKYVLTNVTVTQTDDDPIGYFGVYPGRTMGGSLAFAPGSVFTASLPQTLGNSPIAEETPTPDRYAFGLPVRANHILAEASGTLALSGPGAVKAEGLDLRFDASENVTVVRTGISRSASTPAATERYEAWVFLEWSEGTLSLGSRGGLQVASAQFDGRFEGGFVASDATGTVSTAGHTYEARGTETAVRGDFAVELLASTSREAKMAVSLAGDLSDTSIAGRARVEPGVSGQGVGWGVGLVVLGVAVGAAAFAFHRVRSARGPLDLEEYRELAIQAMEAGRHGEALEWLERARRLAPSSAALLLDEAHCRGEMGDLEGALSSYDEAERLSPNDGEAAYESGLLLFRVAPERRAEAEERLLRGVRQNPVLAFEIGLSAEVEARLTPAAREALRRAQEGFE